MNLINQALVVLKNTSGDQQTRSCTTTSSTHSPPKQASTPSSTRQNAPSFSNQTERRPTQEPSEMSRLFPFFGSRGRVASSRQRNSPYARFKPKESWTHTFVCLSDMDEVQTPSRERKRVLKEGGLGEKKVVFNNKNGLFQHLKTVLEQEYPLLKDLEGAFEILRSGGSRRVLEVIPIPAQGYTVQGLKEELGQAIAYVRPLQKCLQLQASQVCIYIIFKIKLFCRQNNHPPPSQESFKFANKPWVS